MVNEPLDVGSMELLQTALGHGAHPLWSDHHDLDSATTGPFSYILEGHGDPWPDPRRSSGDRRRSSSDHRRRSSAMRAEGKAGDGRCLVTDVDFSVGDFRAEKTGALMLPRGMGPANEKRRSRVGMDLSLPGSWLLY